MSTISRAVNTRLEWIEKEREVSGSQESALHEDYELVLLPDEEHLVGAYKRQLELTAPDASKRYAV